MKLISFFLKSMGFMAFIGGLLGCNPAGTGFSSLSVEEFEQCIADTSVVRLDVRTSEEYVGGHLPQALHADVLQPDFESKVLDMLPRGCTIAVYCRSGRRSKRAAEILTKNEFKVVELNDGYTGWTEAGREVVK